MFRPFVEHRVRNALEKTHQVDLLSHQQMMGAISDARVKLQAEHGVDMPACVFEPAPGTVGAIGDGTILAKIKEWIAEFKAWLQTDQGKMFLKIGAIVTAIITMLLAGS